MTFRARATRGLRRPSHGLMARLGVPVGGWVRKLRAVEDQSAPIPEEIASELGRMGWATWSSSCSRNAHPQKGLVRRTHSRINQATLEKEVWDWEDTRSWESTRPTPFGSSLLFIWSIWFLWLFWFVWFFWFKQQDQQDRPNRQYKRDRPDPPVSLIHLVLLVHTVFLVCLVYLVRWPKETR
jgi:hypothetical protein